MGGSSYPQYDQQQQMAFPECEVCPTEEQAFWKHLREHKDTNGVRGRADMVVKVAIHQLDALNVLLFALLMGAIFHTQIFKLVKSKFPKITIGDN